MCKCYACRKSGGQTEAVLAQQGDGARHQAWPFGTHGPESPDSDGKDTVLRAKHGQMAIVPRR